MRNFFIKFYDVISDGIESKNEKQKDFSKVEKSISTLNPNGTDPSLQCRIKITAIRTTINFVKRKYFKSFAKILVFQNGRRSLLVA